MSGLLIVLAIFVGSGVLFVLALLFEAACGQSPRQHYERSRDRES